ncbi:hypothetical protein CRE_06821 [Caenorhabditis remanei]|uniref:Uncharacterized protein n=1 Tax=Caenorhabditis remanei TaxID=31234 RepID=E3MP03_CAERE|nr:hypothetical protein CRE_06821 [Caenorhabditis remanei]
MISGFDSNKKLCTVCNERPSYGYSYGAFVCNACKNFFRRIHIYKSPLITPIKPCLTGGRCKIMKKCRDCRNRRCLKMGMTPTSHELPEVLDLPKIISKSKSDKEYSNTIQFLKELDRQRTKTFLTRLSMEDLSFDDLITSNSFNLIQRTTNFKPDFYDWATIDQITAIRFMKRFPFFEDLGTQEKKFFIQSSYVQFIILCNAMRTINLKSAEAIYPDNVDVFPVEMKKFYEFCPTKLNRIRCYLVHKLRELRLTPEEFLLLSAILICNPTPMIYTKPNELKIAASRDLYGRTLQKYCETQHQPPIRMLDLMSIIFVIYQTFRDFAEVWTVYHVANPDLELKKLFSDFLLLSMQNK